MIYLILLNKSVISTVEIQGRFVWEFFGFFINSFNSSKLIQTSY